MRIWAHRGASADAPENTLEAFAAAVAQGADGVELDAMVCGSGEVVVCHDEHLGRLAGLDVWVGRTPYAALRGLDVGSRLGFAPARIPLLAEALAALPDAVTVNIELKSDPGQDRGLAEKVARMVEDDARPGGIVLSSFDAGCLSRVARVAPHLRRGLLLDPDVELEAQLAALPGTGAVAVHPHWGHCTPDRVAAWRQAGYTIVAWTVDDADLARGLFALGVDVAITNGPARLRAALVGA